MLGQLFSDEARAEAARELGENLKALGRALKDSGLLGEFKDGLLALRGALAAQGASLNIAAYRAYIEAGMEPHEAFTLLLASQGMKADRLEALEALARRAREGVKAKG